MVRVKTTYILAIFFLGFALIVNTAMASPYFLNSLRAQGMGNAYTAVSNDRYAPFYNPAGLTYLREDSTLTLLDGSYGEIGNIYNDLSKDYTDNKGLIDSKDLLAQAEDIKALLESPSTYRYYRINLLPLSYTRRNFAIGLYGVANAYAIYGGDFIDIDFPTSMDDIESLDDLLDLLSFDPSKAPVGIAYTESGAGLYTAISSSVDTGIGSLSYGVNLRIGTRFTGLGHVTLDFKLNQEIMDSSILAESDLGLIYSLQPSNVIYRGGVSYNNLFLTEFAKRYRNGTVADRAYKSRLSPTVLNTGGAMIVPRGGSSSNSTITLAVDVPDVLDNRGLSEYGVGNVVANRLNYGIEADFKRHLAVRAGLNEGYGTLGLGVKIPAIRVDYAYYVERPPAPVTIVARNGGSIELFSSRGAVRKHSVNVGFDF